MKYFLLICCSLFFFSCSNESPKMDKSTVENDSLAELSIFHLPSEWKDQYNKTVTLADYRGKISVMVMIYTSCQAACPRLVADMRGISKLIPDSEKSKVNLILVSIDPEVDTPENNLAFLKTNLLTEPYWHFLTGSLENTRAFSMVLGVKYKQISPIDFSHSNIISLFDENGLLVYQQSGLGVDNKEIISQLLNHTKALKN